MKRREMEKKLGRAIEFSEKGESGEARNLFEVLLEATPKDPQVLYNAGIFFSKCSEHIRACELFSRGCEVTGKNQQWLSRLALEEFHVGGGEVFESDFLAHDPLYLKKAEKHIDQSLALSAEDQEALNLKLRIQNGISHNRLAFRFCEGDMEYCRKVIGRKREMTNLDERVMGFLNLLDSGEYDPVPGRFEVVMRSDLPSDDRGGFLDRIRNYVLGK